MSVDSEVQALIDAAIAPVYGDVVLLAEGMVTLSARVAALESEGPPVGSDEPGPRAAGPEPDGMLSVPASVSDIAGLQAFIDGVPDGSAVAIEREYVGYDGLRLDGRVGLTLWGYGGGKLRTTRTDGNITGSCVLLRYGSEDIAVLGMELEGANDPADLMNLMGMTGENSHGVAIEGARDVVVEDCTIHNMNGDAVLMRGWGYTPASYIGGKDWQTGDLYDAGGTTIAHNHAYRLGRQGIANIWGDSIIIDANIIEDVAIYPIDFEDGSDPGRTMREVRIRDNVFRRWNWNTQYPSIAISHAQDANELSGPIDVFEVSGNRFEEGAMGCGNSASTCSAFHKNCGRLLSTRTFNTAPQLFIGQFIFRDNVAALNANNLDCTRTDYGVMWTDWDGDVLDIRNNDCHGQRYIVTGSWASETFEDNGVPAIQRSPYV